MEGGILPSRKELLSRIELICELDNSFIAVAGDPGIGKSTLLEFFIEHHCPNHTKCFVQASGETADTTIIQQILLQLLPDQAIDSNLSIAQNLAECQFETLYNVIVVIDNGQHLDIAVFVELIGMLKAKIDNFNVSVIFAQPMDEERFSQLNARYPLIEIHLEPLNKAESQMLLSYYFQRTIEVEQLDVLQFIARAEGSPAKLMAWQSPVHAKTKKQRHLPAKNTIVLVSVASILVVAMAVASWYFITTTKGPATNLAELKAQLAEQQEKPLETPASTTDTDLEDKTKPPLSEQTDLDSILVQKWDPKALATTAKESSTDKLDKAVEKAANTSIEQRSNPAQSTKRNVDSTPTTTADQSSNLAATDDGEQSTTPESTAKQQVRPTEQNKKPESKDDLLYKMDNQWFLNQPASSVVLQLSGASTEQILQNFLQQHQLGSQAHVYQATRNGKPWYVVTTGEFTSLKQANAAKGQLPESLRLGEPWAKSIGTIQSEILNANQKNQ